MKLLQEWIEFSYSNETISLPNERLFSTKLDQEMIEMISNFTVMSDDQRNYLLNKLAKLVYEISKQRFSCFFFTSFLHLNKIQYFYTTRREQF